MKKIFLLFLSSFLLINVYAQCDEYSISLEDENGIISSNGTNKYICLEDSNITLTDKNVSQGTNPVYTWEIFGITSSTTGNVLNLGDALIEGLFDEHPIIVSKKVDECSEIPSVSINVYPIPPLNPSLGRISVNEKACNGESVELSVVDFNMSISGYYITTFSWNHDSFETSRNIDVKDAGTYVVSVQQKIIGAPITDKQACSVYSESYVVPSCNGIINTIDKIDQLSIYPNPFSSSITLTNIPTGVEKIEVIDVLGNVVESVENPASSIELGEELSTGTYFVYLYSTDGVQVEKVMKVN